jgi:5-methyltetrahydropteroyltriglutamate--homocysteine methyltransferase
MISTTVVGSYPRVGDSFEEQRLRRAIAKLDEGKITEAELKEVEWSVVREVVEEQTSAGISLPTDGEVTWVDSQSHFARYLDGIEVDGLVRYFDTNTYYRQPVVRGRIRWREPAVVEEWRHASSLARGPVKAVVTGPHTLATLAKADGLAKRALVLEFAEAVAQEVRALREAGATHIQIDEPAITRAPKEIEVMKEAVERIAGEKGRAWLCLFTYFGDVAAVLGDLTALPIDNLGLDLVQGGRNGKALAKAGSEVPLTLGAVDARNTRRDDTKALARSLLALKGKVPLAESYVSPSNGLEFLPRDKAREKLGLVVDTARLLEAGL